MREERPTIPTGARRTGATILFLDKSRQQSFTHVRRTWAPEESSAEMRYGQGNRLMPDLISAVRPNRTLYFDVHEEGIDGTRGPWFLEKPLKEEPGRFMLARESGTIRRRKDVKPFLRQNQRRLETLRFPRYAPELDSDEQVWAVLKNQRMANQCPKTGEEIRAGAERELRWIQAHPELVASIIWHSELPLPPIPRALG